MKLLANRRSMLLTVGTVAVAAVAGLTPAHAADIQGTIAFEDDGPIPKGGLRIYLDDRSAQGDATRQPAATEIRSDGGSRLVEFSLTAPPGATAAEGTRIVARLERQDGWLIARGSAQVEAGSPVLIVLHTAMY